MKLKFKLRARICQLTVSVEHAALVGGNHVLDVDECILAAMGLEHLQGVLDQVAQVEALALRVVDLVSEVGVALFEQVHNGKNLSVVGH